MMETRRTQHRGTRRPHNSQPVYDSRCGENRIRGHAEQIEEKYLELANEARRDGNITDAENYLQHADHYARCKDTQDMFGSDHD